MANLTDLVYAERMKNSIAFESLLPFTILSLCLGLFGMFGNLNIVIATIREKELHQKSGFLIGITAGIELLTWAGFIQISVLIWSRKLIMTNEECFFSLIHMNFAMQTSSVFIWINGIDKLIASKFPVLHRSTPTFKYVAIMTLPPLLSAVFLIMVGWFFTSEEEIFVCIPPTAFNSWSKLIWLLSNVTLNVVVSVTYYVVFKHLIRPKNKVESMYSKRASIGLPRASMSRPRTMQFVQRAEIIAQKKVAESLLTVMVVFVLGWFITIGVLLVIHALPISEQRAFLVSLNVGCNAAFGFSCDYYVLFWRSTIYRRAFKKQLPWIFKTQ